MAVVYNVERICGDKFTGSNRPDGFKEMKLYIKWENYPECDNTWEPLEIMLNDIPDTVHKYFAGKENPKRILQHKSEAKLFKLTALSP